VAAAGNLGRVDQHDGELRWRVVFPDFEHAAASSFLRELAASDCSPATVRSYAFALLRWLRFVHARHVGWERAERTDVRAFVEHLREIANPQRLTRRADAPALDSVNPRTGKPIPGRHYAARTINHQLSVLFGFYEHACAADLGPLVNPMPAQRGRGGGRVFAHHNPMEDFVLHRRATYRQKTPRPTWRAIPDDAAEQLFAALRCHRDRALVSFWLSSGARAAELLGLRHGDLDVGAHTITVISKGSRARETPIHIRWLVRSAESLANGIILIRAVGVSEFVQDIEATFFTDLDMVRVMGPEDPSWCRTRHAGSSTGGSSWRRCVAARRCRRPSAASPWLTGSCSIPSPTNSVRPSWPWPACGHAS
jgi:integrase